MKIDTSGISSDFSENSQSAPTLVQYLIAQGFGADTTGEALGALLQGVAQACKAIAQALRGAALADLHGNHVADLGGSVNVQGEAQKKMDVLSNTVFTSTMEKSGNLAGMASEEMESCYAIADQFSKGPYLLVFDPLDGSSNIDVNISVGSIFSVLHAPTDLQNGRELEDADFLQKGCRQVAAGYALYGSATMLVCSIGQGVVGFTLDEAKGDFVLTHPDMRVPENTQDYVINASNSRFWQAPIQRYIAECMAGKSGPRGIDFNMRWVGSMVAEVHRILIRGGVFMYPKDTKDPSKPGRLRLLYEANPMAFIIEQAGGRASTGLQPLLEVQPSSLHQRIGLILGAKHEVERIERYHLDEAPILKGDVQ